MTILKLKLKSIQTEKVIYFLLPLFSFMVPISTLGTTVCLMSVIVLWLITGDYQQKLKMFWVNPIARVFFIFLLGSIISLSYTQAETKDIFNGLKDSVRLAAIGIFLYYFSIQNSDTLKKRCIQAFIWAMILTAVLSYLKYFFHLLPHKQGLTEAAVFKNHIKTSFFMTMAVFFMVEQLRFKPRNIALWLGIVLMSANILFLSEGRIGYMIFSFLALYCFWDRAKMKGLIFIIGLLIGVLLLSQQFSLKIYERMTQIPQDMNTFFLDKKVETSSIGARISFVQVSAELIREKPWFGFGVGGFRQAYQYKVADKNLQTDNPHNEYLRIAVEFGLLGMLWFGYLILSIARYINKIPKSQQFVIKGIGMAFLIGCMANSWLMDFSEGMFIILFLSLFLGKTHADKVIDYRYNVQLARST